MDCLTDFWPLDWKRTLKVNTCNNVSMTFDCLRHIFLVKPHPIQRQKLWSYMYLHFSLDDSKLTGLEIYFELTVF